jgi:hypothetical protein
MLRSDDRHGFLVSALFAVLGMVSAVPAVLATEADMAKLPIIEPFQCAICHVDENPGTLQHELNVFGLDFLENDRLWNAALADLDSDSDGCTNGVELGDKDGSGFPDGNMTALTSNPGVVGDCGELVIDVRTWGALKRLFDRR